MLGADLRSVLAAAAPVGLVELASQRGTVAVESAAATIQAVTLPAQFTQVPPHGGLAGSVAPEVYSVPRAAAGFEAGIEPILAPLGSGCSLSASLAPGSVG